MESRILLIASSCSLVKKQIGDVGGGVLGIQLLRWHLEGRDSGSTKCKRMRTGGGGRLCQCERSHIYIFFQLVPSPWATCSIYQIFRFFFRFFRFFKMSVLLCSFFMIKLCRSIPCKKKAAITRVSIFRCTLRFLQQYSTHHRYHPLVNMRSIQQNIFSLFHLFLNVVHFIWIYLFDSSQIG